LVRKTTILEQILIPHHNLRRVIAQMLKHVDFGAHDRFSHPLQPSRRHSASAAADCLRCKIMPNIKLDGDKLTEQLIDQILTPDQRDHGALPLQMAEKYRFVLNVVPPRVKDIPGIELHVDEEMVGAGQSP